MSLALAFALRNWKFLAGGLLVAVLAMALALHVHHDHKVAADLAKVRAEVVKVRADNALWQAAYRDEKRAVSLQNARIAQVGKDSAAWQARAVAATAEAHRATVKAQRSAAAFLAREPVGATVCDRVADVAGQIRGAQ